MWILKKKEGKHWLYKGNGGQWKKDVMKVKRIFFYDHYVTAAQDAMRESAVVIPVVDAYYTEIKNLNVKVKELTAEVTRLNGY